MKNRTLVIEALVYKRNKAFGYQEYLFNLLDYFFENRIQIKFEKIIIICEYSSYDDFSKYKDQFIIKRFKLINTFSRLILQFLISNVLHLKKDDVILFTGNYSSLIKQSIHVLVIHDLLYLRKNIFPNFLMRIQRGLYIPRSVALADVIIAISDFTKSDILRNIKTSSNKPIYKIFNYFNFKKYSSFDGDSVNLNLPKKNYFLCVSSSLYHKNLITIIKAFEKYCLYQSKMDLIIISTLGRGSTLSYYNQMEKNIKNKIHFFTNITNKELAVIYKNCDAYISASYFEGLGMPIIEAMFFNVSLILSDIEVFREITNGKAIFFNPNSFEDLFQILNSYEKKVAIDTQSFVLEKFSALKTSQKYIDLLNSL